MHPLDVPTDHTLAFVLQHVPRTPHAGPARRVLEIGAGDGRLARAMLDAGLDVTALDIEPERVAQASERGVRTVLANWPEHEPDPGPPFDAIVFSRSLHHVSPLDAAIARATDPRILAPTGRIIVDDFALDEADEPAIRWLATTLRRLVAAREIKPVRDGLPARLVVARDPVAEIRSHVAHHHLHAAADMRAALEAHAHIAHAENAPYLYRWVAAAASQQPRPSNPSLAADLVQQILATEHRLIDAGTIGAIGRRWVATPR